jgi:hypothetical protein
MVCGSFLVGDELLLGDALPPGDEAPLADAPPPDELLLEQAARVAHRASGATARTTARRRRGVVSVMVSLS